MYLFVNTRAFTRTCAIQQELVIDEEYEFHSCHKPLLFLKGNVQGHDNRTMGDGLLSIILNDTAWGRFCISNISSTSSSTNHDLALGSSMDIGCWHQITASEGFDWVDPDM